ncbi:MAG: type II secretion system minor pseudopilin GspJ [Sphingomonadales bacterium]
MKGFTLVETLIAIALFALVATGGSSLLQIALTSQDTLTAASERTRELQRARAVMRADFGQFLDRPVRDRSGALRPSLITRTDRFSLEFVRFDETYAEDGQITQLRAITYDLQDGVLRRAQQDGLDRGINAVPRTLMSQVKAVQARYHVDGAWVAQSAYRSAMTPPRAVELTITKTDGTVIVQRFLTPYDRQPELEGGRV